MMESLFLGLSLLVALLNCEPCWKVFLGTAAFAFVLGFCFKYMGEREKSERFTRSDSYLVVALSWIIFSLIGMVPFLFIAGMNLPSAFFETMSGFTTTGATCINDYYRVIEGKLRTQRSYYYDEIIRSLLQCVIYELCVILNREMGTIEDTSVRSKDVIFKKFMEMLAESGGRERSLKYYAESLFVTPKYLSAVTNDVCGISAHELILNNVASHIRQELEFSSKGIKELSVQFGFPNMSSFGKFVKIRLGKSPRAFRKEK